MRPVCALTYGLDRGCLAAGLVLGRPYNGSDQLVNERPSKELFLSFFKVLTNYYLPINVLIPSELSLVLSVI